MRTAAERATAWIDFGAIRANCRTLKGELGEGAELCAVVKADGYGHGAEACAAAALAGGASRLAVATAAEAEALSRRFGDVRTLVMGALSEPEVDVAVGAGAEIALWREGFRRAALRARPGARAQPVRVHVKYDTGMGRLGNAEPGEVLALARACAADAELELAAIWTHFATADEPDSRFLRAAAGDASRRWSRRCGRSSPQSSAHAANSAAVFREPPLPLRHGPLRDCDLRPRPLPGRPGRARPGAGAVPALLRGRRQALPRRGRAPATARPGRRRVDTWVGVVPLGYGDGVRRGLSNNAEVLVARPPAAAGRDRLDGQPHDRPRARDGRRARRRGGADRRPGGGGDPRRGARRPAGHDQLRGHLRDLRPGAAASRREPSPTELARGAARRWPPGAGARRVRRRLDRRRRGPRRRPGQARSPTSTSPSPATPSAAARAIAAELGEHAFELSAEFGDLAGRLGLAALAGRRRPRCAEGASRPTCARATSRSARSPCRSPAARRSTPSADSPTSSAGVLRAVGERQLRRGPAAPAARGAAGGRARAGDRAGHGRSSPAPPAPRAAEPAGERQLTELRLLLGGPDPLRGLALLDELGLTAGRPARAGGSARRRAGAQPPPRRLRPHAGRARAHRSRSRPTSSASPASAQPRSGRCSPSRSPTR